MAATWGIKQAVENAMKKAMAKLDAILLNLANIADFPAPDSLVCASSKPLQAQQNVLLRAVTASREMHEELLVRASAEAQEKGNATRGRSTPTN